MISGLILLDKPSGPTSHDLVQMARRGTGEQKIGHAGTLDPLASGLLILCLGSAARLSDFVRGHAKRYLARVRLGQTTDTYDADGQVLAESDLQPERAAVEAALPTWRGPILQRPPIYSAVKRGGRKAYEYARAGQALDLEPRPVTIHNLELTAWEPPFLELDLTCSAGTYVRSLAYDLGQALGCGAHLAGLRRTAVGDFNVAEAVTAPDLQAAFAAGTWRAHLLPPDQAVRDWPAVHLSEAAVARIAAGQPAPMTSGETAVEWARAYNPQGELVALLRADARAGLWRPDKVFIPSPGQR